MTLKHHTFVPPTVQGPKTRLHICATCGEPASAAVHINSQFWGEFNALELATVVTDSFAYDNERGNCRPVFSKDDIGDEETLQCYTIYGHLTGGGVRSLADCASVEECRMIAAAISTATGLPITVDTLFELSA